ncbi:MAG: hypothetical protein WBS19_09495 [Candidatus Korobacteraceae bacterium]
MTTQSTLGPFTTLVLNLTAKGRHFAAVANRHPVGVAKSLLFARLLTELLGAKCAGYASPGPRVFRIGSAQVCRAGL